MTTPVFNRVKLITPDRVELMEWEERLASAFDGQLELYAVTVFVSGDDRDDPRNHFWAIADDLCVDPSDKLTFFDTESTAQQAFDEAVREIEADIRERNHRKAYYEDWSLSYGG